MNERGRGLVAVGCGKASVLLMLGLVMLMGTGGIAVSPTPAVWTQDLEILSGDVPPTAGPQWAYDRVGNLVWNETDPNGRFVYYNPLTYTWSPASQSVGSSGNLFAPPTGPYPTPRRGACLVKSINTLTGYVGDVRDDAYILMGGENPTTGVPIGEVNVLKITYQYEGSQLTGATSAWTKVTYTYPQPVSYAACARRNWNGNEGDPSGINGGTMYGGKKDAAGNTNDDVWFFDTDSMQWYFIMDNPAVRRYGAAFVGADEQDNGGEFDIGGQDIMIWGGVGPGATNYYNNNFDYGARALYCWYKPGLSHECATVVEIGERPIPTSAGFRMGSSSARAHYRDLPRSTKSYLVFGGMDGTSSFNSVYLAEQKYVAESPSGPWHYELVWSAFIPSGTPPLTRWYAGMTCSDSFGDCSIPRGASASNPTRFGVWNGVRGNNGSTLIKDTWVLTFGLSEGVGGVGGCIRCPPPTPI